LARIYVTHAASIPERLGTRQERYGPCSPSPAVRPLPTSESPWANIPQSCPAPMGRRLLAHALHRATTAVFNMISTRFASSTGAHATCVQSPSLLQWPGLVLSLPLSRGGGCMSNAGLKPANDEPHVVASRSGKRTARKVVGVCWPLPGSRSPSSYWLGCWPCSGSQSSWRGSSPSHSN
jgi:hypothetical protein